VEAEDPKKRFLTPTLIEDVYAALTTTAIASSDDDPQFGDTVTFTATVTATSPGVNSLSCPTFYAAGGVVVRRMSREDKCRRQRGLPTRK
jgi:hypothetical protein